MNRPTINIEQIQQSLYKDADVRLRIQKIYGLGEVENFNQFALQLISAFDHTPVESPESRTLTDQLV